MGESTTEAAALNGRAALHHATPGRLGRQPAHWLLRERGVRQAELARVTARSSGYVSEVLRGAIAPDPAFVAAVSEFLRLAPSALFTQALLEAVARRQAAGSSATGRPPSAREGPYGRQPAYWRLRERGIRQDDLMPILGRSRGHISAVLNGFSVPDARFVQVVSDLLQLPADALFTTSLRK